MKTINQKNKWSKRFALVACKSVSCFLIVGLLFLTSCNSSSDPVSSDNDERINNTEGNNTEGNNTEGNNTEGNNTEGNNTEGNNTEGNNTEGNNTEGNNTEGNNTEGNNTEGNNTEGNNTEGNNTEGNNTEGNNTEGNNTEGNNTEGNNTEGNNTEGNNTDTNFINIESSDLIINYRYLTREKGYKVDESLWKVALREGVTADIDIIESTELDNLYRKLKPNQIEINESGDITLKEQLDIGFWGFMVRVTGTGNYQGSYSEVPILHIIKKVTGETFVDENDFNFDIPPIISLEEGYGPAHVILGRISQKEDSKKEKGIITPTYSFGDNPRAGSIYAISVSPSIPGQLDLRAGLGVGNYPIYVRLAFIGIPYSGTFSKKFVVSIVPKEK